MESRETLRLVDLDTVPSTNDEALRLAARGAPSWTVLRAIGQSAGRGRRGRPFVSPPGNSYTSFIVRPEAAPDALPQIALVAGLAVAEALERVAPELPKPLCKWPNDVLIDGCKVCGILVEADGSQTGPCAVVIGIGVNLVTSPDLPHARAGSVTGLGGPTLDRDAWLAALAERLQSRMRLWEREGFAAMRGALLARMAGVGCDVTVSGPPPLAGRLVGLDADGALLLADGTGAPRRCVSGSLTLEAAA